MSQEPYVFISYAHRDSQTVLSCVQAMRNAGINLWYDDGIEAGSEWPEYIAEKVVGCTKFVLFLSNAYIESQNCKRELNFAISRKKDILSIYIEDVPLSPGMEMQLGTYQALYANRFESPVQFYNSLAREPYFNTCRVKPAAQSSDAQPAQTASAQNTYEQPANTAAPQPENVAALFDDFFGAQTKNGNAASPQVSSLPKKSRSVAALLAFFLGAFGAHKFYLKKPIWGVVYLLFCQTGISFIVGIVDGIRLLCMTNDQFCNKYLCVIK